MNEKEFEELIGVYRAYTSDNLFNEVKLYLDKRRGTPLTSKEKKLFKYEHFYSRMSLLLKFLTGFGSRTTCKLCRGGCENCIHSWLSRRELRPEKEKETDYQYGCITKSYEAIEEAKTVKELSEAYQNRANYLEECLEIYKREVKNE